MSLVFVVAERRDAAEYGDKEERPLGVYAIRILTDKPTEKVLDRLMISMCRQVKERYEGFEDLTPTKMAKRLEVRVYYGTPVNKTWPDFLGCVYRDRRGVWSW